MGWGNFSAIWRFFLMTIIWSWSESYPVTVKAVYEAAGEQGRIAWNRA